MKKTFFIVAMMCVSSMAFCVSPEEFASVFAKEPKEQEKVLDASLLYRVNKEKNAEKKRKRVKTANKVTLTASSYLFNNGSITATWERTERGHKKHKHQKKPKLNKVVFTMDPIAKDWFAKLGDQEKAVFDFIKHKCIQKMSASDEELKNDKQVVLFSTNHFSKTERTKSRSHRR